MTKADAKTAPPLVFMFDKILSGWHCPFHDSKAWRLTDRYSDIEWLQPLIDLGAVREARIEPGDVEGFKPFNLHFFEATEIGINWWCKQHTKELPDRAAAYLRLIQDSADPQLEGKGIGALLGYSFFRQNLATVALAGIEDGFFEFVSLYYYYYGESKSVTVRLTENGLKYFDSLPRLTLECA